MDFGKLADLIKLPVKYAWALAIASGLVLFLPEAALKTLNVYQLKQNYGVYIGLGFLLFFVLAIVHTASAAYSHFKRRRRFHAFNKERYESLQRLDQREKSVLREFFVQNQNTLRLPVDDPTVAGLMSRGILVRVGKHGEGSLAGILFPLKIADDVADQLLWNMIDLSREPSDTEIDWVLNNRPDFIPEIQRHMNLFHRSGFRRRLQ